MTKNDVFSAFIEAFSVSGITRVLLGQNGSWIIDDTSAHSNIDAYSIIPMSETVIASCIVLNPATGESQDLVSTRNWGATLSAGSLHRAPIGWVIKSITLTSGSIVYY